MRNLDNIPKGKCVCSVCSVGKDNTEFQWYMNRHTKDGYRLRVNTNCRSCSKKLGKELREIKKSILKEHPQPQYGNPCDMCGKLVYKNKASVPSGVDGVWGWQCDHDHDTNEFRGWICKKCNTGLGTLGDDLDSILRVVDYLSKKK